MHGQTAYAANSWWERAAALVNEYTLIFRLIRFAISNYCKQIAKACQFQRSQLFNIDIFPFVMHWCLSDQRIFGWFSAIYEPFFFFLSLFDSYNFMLLHKCVNIIFTRISLRMLVGFNKTKSVHIAKCSQI